MGPLVYPEDYPPNCPPPDRVPADGAVFRITAHSPPVDEDFLSEHELGWVPKHKPTASRRCRSRSLSVYRDVKDAVLHLELFSGHGGFIAAGTLSPDRGVTKLVGDDRRPTHTEWWCFNGQDRKSGFLVIEGRDDVAN